MQLRGRTAIVTGGASGFGAGIVRKFVAEGAQVLIADLNGAAAQDIATELGAYAVIADVSTAAGFEEIAQAAHDTLGTPDIVVNNAGITHLPQPLEDVAENAFDRS